PIPFGTVPMVGVAATDMTACHGSPQFQLTGPGVNLFTTMTAGCESDKAFPETFQPDGTYVAQDLNQPSATRTSFTIAHSGTPIPAPTTVGTGVGTVDTGLVGSGVVKATIDATLNAKGGLTLTTTKGKPVTTLSAGRYKIVLLDKSAKVGVSILG